MTGMMFKSSHTLKQFEVIPLLIARILCQKPQDSTFMCFKVHVVQPGMVILADALDPNKKGVGAAQGSCLGDYMAVAIERCNGATDFGATCFFFMSHLFFTRFFCWG